MGRPRSDALDDWLDTYGGSMIAGQCDAVFYPDDLTLQSEADLEEWRDEIAAKLARRRPAGFAPWPNE